MPRAVFVWQQWMVEYARTFDVCGEWSALDYLLYLRALHCICKSLVGDFFRDIFYGPLCLIKMGSGTLWNSSF